MVGTMILDRLGMVKTILYPAGKAIQTWSVPCWELRLLDLA